MKQERENDLDVIIADEGKIFRRIADGINFGEKIYLGYMHYINNELVDPPIMATPEMFEEIDAPIKEEPKHNIYNNENNEDNEENK